MKIKYFIATFLLLIILIGCSSNDKTINSPGTADNSIKGEWILQ